MNRDKGGVIFIVIIFSNINKLGSRDGTARFWDTRTYNNPITIDLNDRVRSVRPLDPSSPIFLIASGGGLISYYDIRKYDFVLLIYFVFVNLYLFVIIY